MIIIEYKYLIIFGMCFRGVVAKVLYLDIVINEHDLKLLYNVHVRAYTLGKIWTPYPFCCGLDCTIVVLLQGGLWY